MKTFKKISVFLVSFAIMAISLSTSAFATQDSKIQDTQNQLSSPQISPMAVGSATKTDYSNAPTRIYKVRMTYNYVYNKQAGYNVYSSVIAGEVLPSGTVTFSQGRTFWNLYPDRYGYANSILAFHATMNWTAQYGIYFSGSDDVDMNFSKP